MSTPWNIDDWTPWAQPALPYFLVLTLNPSFGPLRDLLGAPLFTSVIVFDDGQGTWVFRNEEASDLGRRMIDYLSVPANRGAFEDSIAVAEAELLTAISSCRAAAGLDLDETLDAIERLEGAFTKFYRLAAFIEPVQIAGQQRINSYLQRFGSSLADSAGVPEAELTEIVYAVRESSFGLEIVESLAEIASRLSPLAESDLSLQALLDRATTAGDQHPLHVIDEISVLLKSSHPEVFAAVVKHAERFSWSKNNYARCVEIGPGDVISDLLDLGGFATAQESLARQAAGGRLDQERRVSMKAAVLALLPTYEANLVSLHDLIGTALLDRRKMLVMMTNGALTRLLSQVSDQVGVESGLLGYLIPQELRSFIAAPARYEDRLRARRESFLVYQADFGVLDEFAEARSEVGPVSLMDGPYLAEGAKQVSDTLTRLSTRLNLIEHSPAVATEIRGTVVFRPEDGSLVRGRVAVVRDPQVDGIELGDILVASSTTPDFMAAIHKCSAIVTDWGGLTSHAAITARELRKPCIIGTNFASSVLRSGDEVEIDTNAGLIRRVD